MIFHTRHNKIKLISLNSDGIDIDRIKDFNFLGLVINEHLYWTSYTEKVANKISKTIGILNRLIYKNHFI